MAKRRTQSAQIVRSYSQPRAPSPVIKVSVPRPVTAPKGSKRKHHRKTSSKSSHGALTVQTMLGFGGAGAALGFIEDKFGSSLPSIPVVGKKGALAILAYLAAKNGVGGQIARDIAVAAAAVSGYQLGKEGKISGEEY